MIDVRRTTETDASALAALLNEIVEQGGTTARTQPITEADMSIMMANTPEQSAWHVALNAGVPLGFQYIQPREGLPPEACDIATFVQIGRTGIGIGTSLFSATVEAAKSLGYGWISANIRADNDSGLSYYHGRGFRDYDRMEGFRLASGLVVDKVVKRYDL